MKYIFSALIAALAVVCAMIALLFYIVNTDTADEPVYSSDTHVQIILKDSSEYFWKRFKEGAADKSDELGLFVEYVDIGSENAENSERLLRQAIYSSVDLVAFRPQDSELTAPLLEEAKERGVEALAYESDSLYLSDLINVGSNSYSIGSVAGSMGADAVGGSGSAVVILGASYGTDGGQLKSMKLQGIMEAFAASNVELLEVYILSSENYAAEQTVNRIWREYPDVSLILCLDERSTPIVAQAVVAANRVGSTCVVGYGAMPQTIEYIERGVIYGSVYPDAYAIGRQLVEQACAILEGESAPLSENIEIFSITAENAEQFSGEDK